MNVPGFAKQFVFSELNSLLSTSRDWDELLWAWTGWRNKTGHLMLDDYANHVKYLNKQAQISGTIVIGPNSENWEYSVRPCITPH